MGFYPLHTFTLQKVCRRRRRRCTSSHRSRGVVAVPDGIVLVVVVVVVAMLLRWIWLNSFVHLRVNRHNMFFTFFFPLCCGSWKEDEDEHMCEWWGILLFYESKVDRVNV